MTTRASYLPTPPGDGFTPDKEVFVNAYERTSKLGNLHWVRAHWRGLPVARGKLVH